MLFRRAEIRTYFETETVQIDALEGSSMQTYLRTDPLIIHDADGESLDEAVRYVPQGEAPSLGGMRRLRQHRQTGGEGDMHASEGRNVH